MLNQLRSRRSIRKYTRRPLDAEVIERLAEAVLRAPTSRGRNTWEFVFVTDPSTLTRLAGVKPHGASFLDGAALAIVVCGDPAICDIWVEDCSIAATVAHLAAHAEGLGSCWVQIRGRQQTADCSAEHAVRTLIGLPDTLNVECIIAVGHRAEEKPGHPRNTLPAGKIHRERYGG
jgi:nitroreductase